MRTSAAHAQSSRPTRQLAACEQLPLAGLGLHTVMQGDATVREQLHVVADERAMQLLRWPKHPSLAPLQAAVRDAVRLLHGLCSTMLREVEPSARHQQAAQAAASGDPSVLDLFLYPNAQPLANMRTHTDPGLLTLKRVSATPGLQVLDAASGEWVDVEADAAAGDLVLLCSEALQVMSGGALPAAPHRVRHAGAPRLSVVFELRLHEAVAPQEAPAATPPRAKRRRERGQPRAGVAATPADAEDPAAEREFATYVRGFVAARMAAGSCASDVFAEFGMRGPEARAAAGLGVDGCAERVLRWVMQCRAAEEAEEARQAFARAEYVEVTPAFADCTGRFVDVHVPRDLGTGGSIS